MRDFRVGYLYSLSPVHCGGEGDLGNILDIVREAHTDFPYIPGSSLRGGIRDDVKEYVGKEIADRLFGKELEQGNTQMGVHQVWFGDARLLWVPMRTMSINNSDVFCWVSCPTLLRDHALISRNPCSDFPDYAIGDCPGTYTVADAQVTVKALGQAQKTALQMQGNWPTDLGSSIHSTWQCSRIILPDGDFQILMEHALWTQIRNKIQESGGAEVFWTDICIPRDTIFYYAWGYTPDINAPVIDSDHNSLIEILTGLIQVGGQANVGRGWVQSWVGNNEMPSIKKAERSLEAKVG
jgi:CRISPR-associated protein Cmr4